jgi:hypothetical protein
MKISFEKKYFLGFIVILVVVASGWIFYHQLNEEGYHNGQHIRLDRNFFVYSFYSFINCCLFRSQLQTNKVSQKLLYENSYYSLSLTIPLAPSSLKKLNGELID